MNKKNYYEGWKFFARSNLDRLSNVAGDLSEDQKRKQTSLQKLLFVSLYYNSASDLYAEIEKQPNFLAQYDIDASSVFETIRDLQYFAEKERDQRIKKKIKKAENQIREIEQLAMFFGDVVVNCALVQLFTWGVENAKECAEKAIAEIDGSYSKTTIISPQMAKSIAKCAATLAEYPISDLLGYIQVRRPPYGIYAHPGRIVEFVDNDTNKHIMQAVLDYDTTDDILSDIVNSVETELAAGKSKYAAIRDTLNRTTHRWSFVVPDDELYV